MDAFGLDRGEMPDRAPLRFLLIVRLRTADRVAIAEAATEIMGLASRLSRKEHQLAFSSADSGTFAVFLKTPLAARQIRAAVEGLKVARNDTMIWVLELGAEFDAIGNSRGWQWLQHH